MTADQFNDKYAEYLAAGHYGMDIEHPQVIEYLDREFTEEIQVNTSFRYTQIKMKYDTCRIYADSDKTTVWESTVNQLINHIHNSRYNGPVIF